MLPDSDCSPVSGLMRYTLQLPDPLFSRLKARAALTTSKVDLFIQPNLVSTAIELTLKTALLL